MPEVAHSSVLAPGLPGPLLVVQQGGQGLPELLVPVGVLVRDANAVKELLDVVLHNLPVDLQRQHEVREGRLRETDALPGLEYLFELPVLPLRPVEVLGLLVADGLKEGELVLDIELHELDHPAFFAALFNPFLSILLGSL